MFFVLKQHNKHVFIKKNFSALFFVFLTFYPVVPF